MLTNECRIITTYEILPQDWSDRWVSQLVTNNAIIA